MINIHAIDYVFLALLLPASPLRWIKPAEVQGCRYWQGGESLAAIGMMAIFWRTLSRGLERGRLKRESYLGRQVD